MGGRVTVLYPASMFASRDSDMHYVAIPQPSLLAVIVCRYSFPAGGKLLARARWRAFISSVAEIQMVPADVVGCRRFVRDAAAAVNGVRVVTVSGLRAAVDL